MCNCFSYNSQQGVDKPVLLKTPEWFTIKSFNGKEYVKKKVVSIDFCIVKVIKHLWDNCIETLGSCCMHNELSPLGKCNPNIVIRDNYPKKVIPFIEDLIKQVDDREWDILQWVDYGIDWGKTGIKKVN